MGTYTAKTKNIAARPRNRRLRDSAVAPAQTATPSTPSPSPGGGISQIGLEFASDMGFVVSPGTLTQNGTFGVSLGAGREIPLTDRIIHNNGGSDQPRTFAAVYEYPETEELNTLYFLLEE